MRRVNAQILFNERNAAIGNKRYTEKKWCRRNWKTLKEEKKKNWKASCKRHFQARWHQKLKEIKILFENKKKIEWTASKNCILKEQSNV